MRALRIGAVVIASLLVLAAAAIFVSAASDRPARTVGFTTEISAPRYRVWEALTDVDHYRDWNPVITQGRGDVRKGGHLELRLEIPGHKAESLDSELITVKVGRKLRWQDRYHLPGLYDREYEVRLRSLGPNRTWMRQATRVEGLLEPVRSSAGEREALERIAVALDRYLNGQPYRP